MVLTIPTTGGFLRRIEKDNAIPRQAEEQGRTPEKDGNPPQRERGCCSV
jgi:hypothetical protein